MYLKCNKFWSNDLTWKSTNTGASINSVDDIVFPPDTKNEDKGKIARKYILDTFDKENSYSIKNHDSTFMANCLICLHNIENFGIGYVYSFRELIEVVLRKPNVEVTYDCGDWILKNNRYWIGNEYSENFIY